MYSNIYCIHSIFKFDKYINNIFLNYYYKIENLELPL